MERVLTKRMGAGGSPGYLYVLYGESTSRCALSTRLGLSPPNAKITVISLKQHFPVKTVHVKTGYGGQFIRF